MGTKPQQQQRDSGYAGTSIADAAGIGMAGRAGATMADRPVAPTMPSTAFAISGPRIHIEPRGAADAAHACGDST